MISTIAGFRRGGARTLISAALAMLLAGATNGKHKTAVAIIGADDVLIIATLLFSFGTPHDAILCRLTFTLSRRS
jgi:hypothetical protein